MKIYVTHSFSFDFKTELYQPLRNSELNNKNRIIFPYENNSEPINSKELMKECDLILSEVSYPSTGQGMELGWADLYKIPIVFLYKKGAKLSRSLKIVSDKFIEYQNRKDLIQKLTDYLATYKNQ